MKMMKIVTLPAQGGRYEIYRNGEPTGDYRLQPHTAAADIIQRKIDEPDAEFEFRQTIAVRCVATFEDTDDQVLVYKAVEGEVRSFTTEE